VHRCYTALSYLAGPAAVGIAIVSLLAIGPGPIDWPATAARLAAGIGLPVAYAAFLLPAAVGAWIGPDERTEPEVTVSPL
jgi:hypothetical protein